MVCSCFTEEGNKGLEPHPGCSAPVRIRTADTTANRCRSQCRHMPPELLPSCPCLPGDAAEQGIRRAWYDGLLFGPETAGQSQILSLVRVTSPPEVVMQENSACFPSTPVRTRCGRTGKATAGYWLCSKRGAVSEMGGAALSPGVPGVPRWSAPVARPWFTDFSSSLKPKRAVPRRGWFGYRTAPGQGCALKRSGGRRLCFRVAARARLGSHLLTSR